MRGLCVENCDDKTILLHPRETRPREEINERIKEEDGRDGNGIGCWADFVFGRVDWCVTYNIGVRLYGSGYVTQPTLSATNVYIRKVASLPGNNNSPPLAR
jgi:hypothetical protein